MNFLDAVKTPLPLEDGISFNVDIGPLAVFLRKTGSDLYYATKHQPDGGEALSEPEEPAYKRLCFEEKMPPAVLAPALPPKMVVVKPEVAFSLLPGEKIQLFVSIPLWVQLVVQKSVVMDEPCVILSKTWFGEPTEGELGFALKTRAKRNIEELEQKPHRALCPLRVKNQSSEVLHFERVCIRTQNLSLFQGLKHFWTNDVGVTYRGSELEERVFFGRGAPRVEGQLSQVSSPRQDVGRGSLLRAVHQVTSRVDFGGS